MFDLCFHFVCRHDSSISFVRNMCIKFARLEYRYTKQVKTLSHVFSLFINIDICTEPRKTFDPFFFRAAAQLASHSVLTSASNSLCINCTDLFMLHHCHIVSGKGSTISSFCFLLFSACTLLPTHLASDGLAFIL